RPARPRVELRAVRLELEVRARVKRLAEVARVLDDRDHEQPDVAVRVLRQAVEILGDRRLLAVRHAVLAKIALAEVRGHDLQRAALADRTGRRRTSAQAPPAAAGGDRPRAVADQRTGGCAPPGRRALPLCDRMTLPGLLAARPRGRIE